MKLNYFKVLVLLICIMLLTSCSGYNPIMCKHLCDENNYHSYRGEIYAIYYYDEDGKKVSMDEFDEHFKNDVIIEIKFKDYSLVEKFLGGHPSSEYSLEEYKFAFRIIGKSNQVLSRNGFYDSVTLETPINVTSSSFIYMDSNFFYIAAITYNEKEYLCFEEGFESIVEHINSHKSIF